MIRHTKVHCHNPVNIVICSISRYIKCIKWLSYVSTTYLCGRLQLAMLKWEVENKQRYDFRVIITFVARSPEFCSCTKFMIPSWTSLFFFITSSHWLLPYKEEKMVVLVLKDTVICKYMYGLPEPHLECLKIIWKVGSSISQVIRSELLVYYKLLTACCLVVCQFGHY